jgi:putative protease
VQALTPTFQLLTLSPELSKGQLARMIALSRQSKSVPALELVVQGNLEVIVSEDCIPYLDKDTGALTFWGLQDFRRIFPLRLDDEKRTHVFNAAETCLLDWMPELFEIGLDRVAVDARGRTERYAQDMAQIYLKAIEMTEKSLSEGLCTLKDSIRPMALGGITSGHFLKGLREDLS